MESERNQCLGVLLGPVPCGARERIEIMDFVNTKEIRHLEFD